MQKINRAGLQTIDADSLDQVRGRCIFPMVSEEYRDAFRELTHAVFKGESGTLEFKMIGLKGRPVWLYTHAVPLRNKAGQIVFALATTIDITERKQIEADREAAIVSALQEKNKTEAIIAALGDAISIQDTNYKILYQNQVSKDIYGDRVGEYCYRGYKNQEQVCGGCHLSSTFKDGKVRRVERSRNTDKGIQYYEKTVSPLKDPSGKIIAGIELVRDITERKKADEALRESEERLRQAVRVSQSGIFDHDHLTETVYWSPRQTEIYGWGPHETVTLKGFLDSVYPEDRERIAEAVRGAHDPLGLGQFAAEHRVIRRDGAVRWVTTRAQTFFDGGGVPRAVRTVGATVDITEHKRAEEEIRRSEQFIRRILDTVDESFIVIDRDYRILTANKAYCRQTGRGEEEILGRHCYEISHNISRPCYEAGEGCAVRQVFETGEPHTAQHHHTDAKGNILDVETRAYPIKDTFGNVTAAIETINNVTEKHLLEEERLKREKLESIGTLAGGVAHDFNNLLQGIFGYISMAKMFLDHREKSLAMLEQAEDALHQSISLTTQLLTFSKGGTPVKKRMPLLPVIENAAKFALSGSRSNYSLDIEPGLWQVDADGGQLGRVIQNIVLNADQAMPEGGTVVITAKNVSRSEEGHPLLSKGKYIEISVQDSGIGIPEKYLQKVFDPYFTTKEKGSGLGLATSYSIIRNHDGFIDVTSELGKGTTFFIYLPAVEAEQLMEVPLAIPSSVRKGKILVMDDEELVRGMAEKVIKVLGHDVELANHGEAAIEKYQAAIDSGKPFDIVILDLTIRGGMGGMETLKQLKAIDPGIRAIVSSGYSADAVMAYYEKYGFKARLTKPYKVEDLRDTLNLLLG